MNQFSAQRSIAIIICHYGVWPWYFRYFIHSCSYNLDIQFYVVTDNRSTVVGLPSNVRIVTKSLTELHVMISSKLGFPVNITAHYKLCDFKPAFGHIFSELVKGYEFWGQSDIDVIYGNIREFITDRMLDTFDFINIRHDYTTGCFFIARNTQLLNELFKKSKDYKKILMSSRHYCFDECNFAHRHLSDGRSILEVETEIESFTHVVRKAEREKLIKAYFDFHLIEGRPGRICFDNGRLTYKNRFEAILYHLIGLKNVYNPRPSKRKLENRYFISPSRVYNRK